LFNHHYPQVLNIIGRGGDQVGVEIPFTPRAKKVLENSQEQVPSPLAALIPLAALTPLAGQSILCLQSG